MAELVDALVSNTSDSNIVPVRSRLWAPSYSEMSEQPIQDEKQLAIDKRYLQMARIWASNSYCKRRQVGALLVKDKMIISDGYNGTPSGFENECEEENDMTKSYVLHAEANAITKVAKSNNSSEGSTLYITTSPCMECSKLIIQSGIKRVVYEEKYRITDGLDLLDRARIDLVHITDSTK
jgi:dCMP deaminase